MQFIGRRLAFSPASYWPKARSAQPSRYGGVGFFFSLSPHSHSIPVVGCWTHPHTYTGEEIETKRVLDQC
jgi:hypothetical protein